jgi:two-component system, NarL family, sensor histidine kinase UhpB
MSVPHPVLPSLTARVLLLNSLVMVGAVVLLAFGPATVSSPIHARELLVLLAGVGAAVAANLVLVRRAFAPLEQLTGVMRTIDPLVPGTRVHVRGGARETRELAAAFNDMLERLEDERRESARRAVRAQEAERRRLARELHDELGQSLTGVLLQVDHAIRTPGAPRLEEARETARRSLEDVRRIARDLRPDTLQELGLASALNALATRLTRHAGVAVERRLDGGLPELAEDAEVVVYRVAQEALTNVARHAGATRVTLALAPGPGATAVLTVDDDGAGLPAGAAGAGRGITGMRERALLVRGRLELGRSPLGGARVRLEVPVA